MKGEISPKGKPPVAIIKYAQNNNVLYPLDAEDGTQATVAFPGLDDNTHITLYWTIKGKAEPVFVPLEGVGNASGTLHIDIPSQWVSRSIGHTVEIYYIATVGDEDRESFVLDLEVQYIREADLVNSLPAFANATGNPNSLILDMSKFNGDETVLVKAWPMIEEGQRLFVSLAGDQHLQPLTFLWVGFDHVVTEAEAHPEHVFQFVLSRAWLARREDYSSLTIHMAVNFAGTAPNASEFPEQTQLPQNSHEFHRRITVQLRVVESEEIPLKIDTRPMSLTGYAIIVPNWPVTGVDVPGNTETRFANGGVPPYEYASTAPEVATSVHGKVIGHSNGHATIHVKDQTGESVSFEVSVENVYRLVINEVPMTSDESVNWAASIGGISSYNTVFQAVVNRCFIPPPRLSHHWTASTAGRYGNYIAAGVPIKYIGTIFPNKRYGGWCLVLT